MQGSRTKNSIKNVTASTTSKIIYIILNFICRTIFIKILGNEYVGLNGLFTNVLGVFSLVDLGIGSAIVFRLYKPIAKEDNEKVKKLILFYKQVYIIIGTIIGFIGITLIPFLGIIVGSNNISEDITIIYLLFLVKTVIVYFLYYKKELIIANQKEYIVSIVELIICIIQNILEIIFLVVTHNYIAYLIIQICTTILERVIISIIANKLYPYLKEKNKNVLSKKEKKEIFSDVKAFIFYRTGYILYDSTDNIIISSFTGINQVGLLSNYMMIIRAIVLLVSSAFKSLTASIGNLNSINDNEKKEEVYYKVFHLSFLVYGYISIATVLLINKFIMIWIGENFLLNFEIAIILGINIYIDGMRYVSDAYRNTLGLFKRGRFIPLISSFINIALSIILVQYIGVFGVLLATVISKILLTTWYDPYIIHKYKFNKKPKRFYLRYLYYTLILIITFCICYKMVMLITIQGILGFLISGIVITILVALVFLVSTFKLNTNLFESLKSNRKNKMINN